MYRLEFEPGGKQKAVTSCNKDESKIRYFYSNQGNISF